MKEIKKYPLLVLFILIVFVFGFFSFNKLAKFYATDEIDYNEWNPNLGTKLETDIASTFFRKYSFVNLNGFMANILGQQKMNGVTKLNNGYLFYPLHYTSDESLQKYVDSTERLNDYLEERGTSLVYVACPYTSSKYDPQLPTGVEDYGNDNIDRFVEKAETVGIDTIDIREVMYNAGINQYDMMYKTDHHWNTEAGFFVAGILSDYIASETGCEVDPRVSDINNYTITKYPKWHLGSRGQRTGRYFAGIDDFDLIIPNFDTHIKRGTKEGQMQDVMIEMSPLSEKNYASRYTYDGVLYSLADFENLDCRNDVKILFVSDSFGKAVSPYLVMGFKEIKYVYDSDSNTITPEMIEEYNPDVVILLYCSDYAFMEGSVDFSFEGF